MEVAGLLDDLPSAAANADKRSPHKEAPVGVPTHRRSD